jgi:hypothetical protein
MRGLDPGFRRDDYKNAPPKPRVVTPAKAGVQVYSGDRLICRVNYETVNNWSNLF